MNARKNHISPEWPCGFEYSYRAPTSNAIILRHRQHALYPRRYYCYGDIHFANNSNSTFPTSESLRPLPPSVNVASLARSPGPPSGLCDPPQPSSPTISPPLSPQKRNIVHIAVLAPLASCYASTNIASSEILPGLQWPSPNAPGVKAAAGYDQHGSFPDLSSCKRIACCSLTQES